MHSNKQAALGALLALGIALALTGCGGSGSSSTTPTTNTPTPQTTLSAFQRTNLVADKSTTTDAGGTAAHIDANLVNPWGIAFAPSGAFWIANNGSGTSTLYDGTGAALPLVVTMPTPSRRHGRVRSRGKSTTEQQVSRSQEAPHTLSSPPKTARLPAGLLAHPPRWRPTNRPQAQSTRGWLSAA